MIPSQEEHDRWMIGISEYARIDHPRVWDHGRNPIRYTSLEQLGISLDGLKFQPMPSPSDGSTQTEPSMVAVLPGLTIAQAKNGLAATFGVKPEAVEITIRG